MHEIKLPTSQVYSITIDTWALAEEGFVATNNDGSVSADLGEIVNPEIMARVEQAKRNGGQILYAAISVEQRLEELLLDYFMPENRGDHSKRYLLKNEVLTSSYISFHAKKEIVFKIIASAKMLKGKEQDTLQNSLKKIAEWRNAFAHGKIQHDVPRGCYIEYYSGRRKEIDLDDAYWMQVERTFVSCDKILIDAQNALRRSQA